MVACSKNIKSEGTYKLTREAPPHHFRFKVESFSAFSFSSLERYETSSFEAGEYKWKLALYPKGNKRDGKDHISLNLVAADKIDFTKEITVKSSLFVFDHIHDEYLVLQEVTRFHSMKSESGFDKFLPIKISNEPSKGYLLDDSCVFGAEVFVLGNQNTAKGVCLTMSEAKPTPFKYIWKIEKFSKLDAISYWSKLFTSGHHQWKIRLYPKGDKPAATGGNLSLFLHRTDENPGD